MSYVSSLQQGEREIISKRTDNYGNQQGVDALLEAVRARSPTAFYQFMGGVFQEKHHHLFEIILNFTKDETVREQLTGIKNKTDSKSGNLSHQKLDSIKMSDSKVIVERLNEDRNWEKLLNRLDLTRKETKKIDPSVKETIKGSSATPGRAEKEAKNHGETLMDNIDDKKNICQFVENLRQAGLDTVLNVFIESDDLKKYLPPEIKQPLLSNADPKTTTCTNIKIFFGNLSNEINENPPSENNSTIDKEYSFDESEAEDPDTPSHVEGKGNTSSECSLFQTNKQVPNNDEMSTIPSEYSFDESEAEDPDTPSHVEGKENTSSQCLLFQPNKQVPNNDEMSTIPSEPALCGHENEEGREQTGSRTDDILNAADDNDTRDTQNERIIPQNGTRHDSFSSRIRDDSFSSSTRDDSNDLQNREPSISVRHAE